MKQSTLIAVVYFTFSGLVSAQENEPFSYLTKLEINPTYDGIKESISFNAAVTRVINTKLKDLDRTDPFYAEECDGDMVKAIETKIHMDSEETYTLIYNLTCCCSWGFTIYKTAQPDEPIGRIIANQLFIPGNGNLYSINRIGTDYLVRKKYTLEDGALKEVKQPLNYVGIKSKTLRPIKIYAEKEMKTVIASLPADYEVEVLLSDKEFGKNKLYLMRTNFGLVGWTTLKAGQYKSIDVEGIFYWGS